LQYEQFCLQCANDAYFLCAGTDRGITAIQLDVKLPGGVPLRILDQTLHSAKEGRLHILRQMQQALPLPRPTVKAHAPKAELVRFDEDRKGLLVGPRGDMLKYMQELYDVSINLDQTDATTAYIYGKNSVNVAACSKLIQDIAVVVKEGDTVTGMVTGIMDYGIVVTVNRAQQALLHSSELTHDANLAKKHPSELVKLGQRYNVKVCLSVSHQQMVASNNPIICYVFTGHVCGQRHGSDQGLPQGPVGPRRVRARCDPPAGLLRRHGAH
jgi:polyribonucleotide nucleotidyltransferase